MLAAVKAAGTKPGDADKQADKKNWNQRGVLPHGRCRVSYTLDTNILIGLVQRYPRDIFPAMWKNIESAVGAGEACVCEAILREVHRGGDELHAWAKNLDGFVCDGRRVFGRLASPGGLGLAHQVSASSIRRRTSARAAFSGLRAFRQQRSRLRTLPRRTSPHPSN